ncbi:uncharacterized protein LOC131530227 [Onychostoma macrolepis]|uniref:uncharacterized protein LOC131530227 n=1 Tax=Onychostoma macrolepis TaxID=369639 RepID=UPI0027298ADD|nr:uncharacterized protein LOC131530227 [Onychostoma macrolepis]
MLRRFKGKDNSSTGIILKGLHSLTVASKWSKGVEPVDAELVRTVSKFYGIEEEKVFTELKVFHASYSFTKNNVQEMLKCLKDNEIESVFPSLSELLKIYATLPVSTSTVESYPFTADKLKAKCSIGVYGSQHIWTDFWTEFGILLEPGISTEGLRSRLRRSSFIHKDVSGAGSDGVSVMEGDSVTLHTGVKINQQEKIKWYFNDTHIAYISGDPSKTCTDVQCEDGEERFRDRLKLDHQTGSLTIIDTRTTDSGEYKPVIINGSDSEKIFSVTVHGVSAGKRVEIYVKEGENVTLDPGVIKKTIDPMTWSFNNTLIAKITEDQSKISTDDQWRDRLEVNQTGSLIITNTRTTDSGLYQLQINSSRFSISRSFSVTVTDAGPPSGIRVTVFRGPIDCCDLMKVLYKGREDEK